MSQNIDVFKPVRTKSGRVARIISVEPNDSWPIRADVTDVDGDTIEHSYAKSGIYSVSGRPSDNDLENVPETKTFWVNVYERFSKNCIHKNEEDAVAGSFRGGSINKQDTTLFARVKVTVEEGEGLG